MACLEIPAFLAISAKEKCILFGCSIASSKKASRIFSLVLSTILLPPYKYSNLKNICSLAKSSEKVYVL